MEDKCECKTIEVKMVLPDKENNEPQALCYYRETLKFFGRLSIPAAIFSSVFLFKTEIANIIPKVENINILGLAINLTKNEKEFVKAVSSGDEEEVAKLSKNISSRKIQELVEIKKVAIELSKSSPEVAISKDGISVDENKFTPEQLQKPNKLWKSVLDISWVKPNDIFGRVYFLKIDNGIYLWPTNLDQQSKFSTVLINTSSEGRKKGVLLKASTLKVGEEVLFSTSAYEYSLKLIDIRNAGKINTLAGYFSVMRRKL